jgi:hypothetical protein
MYPPNPLKAPVTAPVALLVPVVVVFPAGFGVPERSMVCALNPDPGADVPPLVVRFDSVTYPTIDDGAVMAGASVNVRGMLDGDGHDGIRRM